VDETFLVPLVDNGFNLNSLEQRMPMICVMGCFNYLLPKRCLAITVACFWHLE
jgi:hypothetical protein